MANAEHGYEYTNKTTGEKIRTEARQPHLENRRWESRVVTPEDNSRDERIAELEAEVSSLREQLAEARKPAEDGEDGDKGAEADDKPATAPKTPAKATAKAKASDGTPADAS